MAQLRAAAKEEEIDVGLDAQLSEVRGILSEAEVQRVEELHEQFFAWEKRKHRLLEVIRAMKCDLLSLVECDHYFDHFQRALEDMGYDSLWRKRPRASSADGCCVAWRRDRFRLLAEEPVEFVDKTCPVQARQCIQKAFELHSSFI